MLMKKWCNARMYWQYDGIRWYGISKLVSAKVDGVMRREYDGGPLTYDCIKKLVVIIVYKLSTW